MITVTMDRAYRVVNALQTGANVQPEVGAVIYCELISRGKATFVFEGPSNALFSITAPLGDFTKALVYAKFVTLPEKIRHRFNINDEGVRVTFRKNIIYRQTLGDSSIDQGTRMLCLIGGAKPLFSYVDEAGAFQLANLYGRERIGLVQDHPISSTTDQVSVEFDFMKNGYPGCRLMFQARLQLGINSSTVARREVDMVARVAGQTIGAMDAIYEVFTRCGALHALASQPRECDLIEAFITYAVLGRGLVEFNRVLPHLLWVIAIDREAAERSRAERQACTSTQRPKAKFGSAGLARKLMQAQYKW